MDFGTPNPYAAPRAGEAVDEPERSVGPGLLASPWRRVGAVMLDGAAAFAVFLAGVIADGAIRGPGFACTMGASAALLLLQLGLLWRRGATIGKRAFGLRVVRPDGADAGFVRLILVRTLAHGLLACIPCVGVLYLVGDLMMLLRDDSHRALHDYEADTIVVDTRIG